MDWIDDTDFKSFSGFFNYILESKDNKILDVEDETILQDFQVLNSFPLQVAKLGCKNPISISLNDQKTIVISVCPTNINKKIN